MRVLIPPGSGELGERVSLDENEVHHLRVRRARDRESVEVLDGAGLAGTGRLMQIGRQWVVELRTAERRARPPELALAVAAGDRERFSWMVEKSVELGVTRVIPLVTARSASVATRLQGAHLRRLQRSAREALKQCGAEWAPSLDEVVTLEEFVQQPLTGTGWLADSKGAPAPAFLDSRPLTVVIGPEGGLTDTEHSALLAASYMPIVLGSYTLRFETAALAAAAAAQQARMRERYG